MRDGISMNEEVIPHFIIRVHGTGAARPEDDGPEWWQNGSEFFHFMEETTAARATFYPTPFRWSGKNSEQEGRLAGLQLLDDWLLALEHHGRGYHLIGHSHGGSVIWVALCEAACRGKTLEHLASWTTVGTPFLHFEANRMDLWLGRIGAALLAALSAALLSVGRLHSMAVSVTFLVLALPLVGIVIPYCFWRSLVFHRASRRVRRLRAAASRAYKTYGDRWLALRSADDEALHGLKGTPALQGEISMRVNSHLGAMISAIRRRDRAKAAQIGQPATSPAPWGRRRRGGPKRSSTATRRKESFWTAIKLSIMLVAFVALLIPVSLGLIVRLESLETASSENLPWMITFFLFLLSVTLFCALKIRGSVLEYLGGDKGIYGDPSDLSTWVATDAEPERKSYFKQRVSLVATVGLPLHEFFAAIQNQIFAPAIDRFIWDRVQRKAQGNDHPGLILESVTEGPIPGIEVYTLPQDAEDEIRLRANSHAQEAVVRLRARLGYLAISAVDLKGISDIFRSEQLISFKELIHNSYFNNDHVRKAIVERICGGVRFQPSPSQAAVPDARFLRGFREASRTAALVYVIPFVILIAICCMAAIVALFVMMFLVTMGFLISKLGIKP
jgi:hypothetical protein